MKTFGTAIPVSALRTKESVGCGEFLDLIPFADFCKKAGLSLIQLLPTNDTGTGNSPYSALSAFALNPIYARLAAFPELSGTAATATATKAPTSVAGSDTTPAKADAAPAQSPATKKILSAIRKMQKAHADEKRYVYIDIRNEKLAILRDIYALFAGAATGDIPAEGAAPGNTPTTPDSVGAAPANGNAELDAWCAKNPWIVDYSVFMVLKDENLQASWKSWKTHQRITRKEIEERWNDKALREKHRFYAWMQWRLSAQFLEAATYARSIGIKLKGDMPIMMNEDSHDAWAYPEFFNHNLRAGAPADGSNPTGQNWGFPTYNWANLAKSGYSWWRDRLVSAAQYYDLFRIDHVLGFFRIWAIPTGETTAALGHTEPYEPITLAELKELGFDKDRIRWLSEPHVPTRDIEEVNNYDYLGTHGILNTIMNRIGEEELWLFKKDIKTDGDIWARDDIPLSVRERLAQKWRDRLLVRMPATPGSAGTGTANTAGSADSDTNAIFVPNWSYGNTTAWYSLNDEEKDALTELFQKKHQAEETLWEKQARTVLGELTRATCMTACAEDLGANIDSMPAVLRDLNIQSLRVVRWNRLWAEEDQPFVPFEEYPAQSVTTTSVHDSTTLRQWWENEPDSRDFARTFCPELEEETDWTPETAAEILRIVATSNSDYIIPPVQDILALSAAYTAPNPEDERVNIPGTVTDFNWSYRLPAPVETLLKDKELLKAIKESLTAVKPKKAAKAKTAKPKDGAAPAPKK